jgi:IclR family acetate operon transcriptional repressor
MRMFTEVGRRLLPHGTGVGKAMLSQMPQHEVRDLLKRTGMPAYTPNTFRDPDLLLMHLAEIANRGYAIDESEQEVGVRCIAVPVKGTPSPAAVSISGPEGRLTDDIVQKVAPIVQRVAEAISETLHARSTG